MQSEADSTNEIILFEPTISSAFILCVSIKEGPPQINFNVIEHWPF